jgi:fumarate reductase (CoM/CoB) subunit A
LAAARDADVEILENTLIVDLLVDDGRVTGAVGIHRNKVGGCVIRAGATVLATGGAGRLFSVTSNPVDVTGGGYALLMRAGGMLRDMEFIQFYPWRLIRPFRSTRVPIQPSTFVSGAKLYNSRGERFMENYDPDKKETATRDISARGIFDQIRLGLSVDGGVILDISDVEDEQFRFENRKVIDRLDPRGINYREIPLILGPEAHFMMGGALVDEFGATVLMNLFACGETAGGLHGGNRINSNALPETQVFGHRAGVAAAETALRRKTGHIDEEIVSKWLFRLSKIRDKNTNVSSELRAILKTFREAMWLGLGIVRTADGLRQALIEVTTTRMKVAALSTERLGDLIAHIELENLCDVATASASSALLRTESRAAHYRDDFPTTDPAWLSTVVYGGGRASVRPLQVEPDEELRLSAAPLQSTRSDEFVE